MKRTNSLAFLPPSLGTMCFILLLGACKPGKPDKPKNGPDPHDEPEMIMTSPAPDGTGEINWTSPTNMEPANK